MSRDLRQSRRIEIQVHERDERKNVSDSVFFCSEIHATDSTVTGCTAKKGRQPRALDLEPAQDQPEQDRARRVQQHADEVIPEHGVAPQVLLDPEGRVQQRVVLLVSRPARTRSAPVPPPIAARAS